MATSTLPPQAYTRDVLAKAFLWLNLQPESIKKLAVTPEALVGLYLRAQRNGEATLENVAPVSRNHFINDLKNLASEIHQFDGPAAATPSPQRVASEPSPAPQLQISKTVSETQTSQWILPAPTIPPLDSKSLELIQDVKVQLNLNSDAEVLRMLIVLGHEKAKMIFPNKS